MKKIKVLTDTSYGYNNTRSFYVPAFSKILNIFMEHGSMSIMIEYDDYEPDNKTIVIKYVEGLQDVDFSDIDIPYYKYWGTITDSKASLINNSNNYPPQGTVNISMNLLNENKYTHIFYNELKSISEERDDKLNELI